MSDKNPRRANSGSARNTRAMLASVKSERPKKQTLTYVIPNRRDVNALPEITRSTAMRLANGERRRLRILKVEENNPWSWVVLIHNQIDTTVPTKTR